MIPIRTDYRMSRTPWVNYGLLAANILVYLAGYHGNDPAAMERLADTMLNPYAPQLHQFITSVFLHANLMHLLGNMVFLWVFEIGRASCRERV